jgi:hypothetical protein
MKVTQNKQGIPTKIKEVGILNKIYRLTETKNLK